MSAHTTDLGTGKSLLYGQELFNENKYTDAARVLSGVVEEDKYNSEALATLGATYYHLDDLEKAEKYLKECLRIDDKHCFSLYYLGLTLNAKKDGLSALMYLEQAIRYCPNDEQLCESAHAMRENLRQTYKEKPLVSKYPRISSYGREWCAVLGLEMLIFFFIATDRMVLEQSPWLKPWLIIACPLLLIGATVILTTVSLTNGVKIFEDKIILQHGLLWRSSTIIKFIQAHPPQEVQDPWDVITGNTKIRILLTHDLLHDRKGEYTTEKVAVIPSIGDREFMHCLSRHIEKRATAGNIPIRSEAPDLRIPY